MSQLSECCIEKHWCFDLFAVDIFFARKCSADDILSVELADAIENKCLKFNFVSGSSQSNGLPGCFLGLSFFFHIFHCAFLLSLKIVAFNGFAYALRKELKCFACCFRRLVVKLILKALNLTASMFLRELAYNGVVLRCQFINFFAIVKGFN